MFDFTSAHIAQMLNRSQMVWRGRVNLIGTDLEDLHDLMEQFSDDFQSLVTNLNLNEFISDSQAVALRRGEWEDFGFYDSVAGVYYTAGDLMPRK